VLFLLVVFGGGGFRARFEGGRVWGGGLLPEGQIVGGGEGVVLGADDLLSI